jgi:hypothetical protein
MEYGGVPPVIYKLATPSEAVADDGFVVLQATYIGNIVILPHWFLSVGPGILFFYNK